MTAFHVLRSKTDTASEVESYFSGERLYGDNFSDSEISAWHLDEREGYANLGAKYREKYQYSYFALNCLHGYRYLGNKSFKSVLGFGSAYGHEFIPLISRIKRITIVDPSDAFKQENIFGVPVKYITPISNGKLPFAHFSFDLITCFGTLHHVPNVTFVVNELHRCLKTGGIALIREPVVSMGDWSLPREGLTKRERGIPLRILISIINKAGFKTLHKSYCVFPPIPKLAKSAGIVAFNNELITRLDAVICKAIRWNLRYHARNWLQKIRPTAAFFVLVKK